MRAHHDHRDQGHSHGGSGWAARLGHAFAPHSHDAADQVDDALATSRIGLRALWFSLVALGVTALLQLAVVLASGSVALLSDTLHNFADALTAVPLAVAFIIGRRAPTSRYTYGYGRAEDLAGLFIIVVIAGSAVLAGWVAIDRLVHPQAVTTLWAVAIAGLVGFAGNEAVARYRIVIGTRIGSAALVADGMHARTDGLTSLAVLLGAGGVAIGWQWADPVVGLLITVMILLVLKDAAGAIYHRLMDAVEPELTARAAQLVASVPGVTGCSHLRLRWVGHEIRAEADVTASPGLTLTDVHRVAHATEDALRSIPRLASATVHVGPHSPTGHDDPQAAGRSDGR